MNEPLRQRQPRVEDPAHLEFVRTKPCCVCGRKPRSDAAHIRMASPERGKGYTGKGMKPDDRYVTPLCSIIPGVRTGCHYDQSDRKSEAAFWERRGLDPFAIAERLWVESGADARHRFDAPGPARKKRKPRRVMAARGFPKIKRPFPKGRGFNR